MHYESGLWHRFLNKTKVRPNIFDINVNGSTVYWRLGLEGTKCATKRIQYASDEEALKAMAQMIDEKVAEGFEHQHSLM